MPQFAYRAKKGPRDIIDGTIEARALDEAVKKLGEIGLLPIHLDEIPSGNDKPSIGWQEPKVRSSEITMFGRQLSSLIKSGVPILRAFSIIGEQSESLRLREFLSRAEEEIKNGRSLSSVLSHYPKLFPPIYIAIVKTGEDSGTLPEALTRISDYRKKQEEIFSRLRIAMAYPALMALTGLGTVIFMLTFVIPRLTKLFSNMGSRLPLPTRLLITISGVFQNQWFWILLTVLIFAGGLLWRIRADQIRTFWSQASLRLPVVKNFILKAEIARFSRTLELLIERGVPILKAIDIAAPVLKNRVLRGEIDESHRSLMGGGSLGGSLKKCKRFPLFMTNLISVGEESGKLDEAMKEIAQFYEHETDEMIKVMTSLIEPLMILVMGLIIGFIMISMLLPMFELNLIVK